VEEPLPVTVLRGTEAPVTFRPRALGPAPGSVPPRPAAPSNPPFDEPHPLPPAPPTP
jgi:hypothetical protein